MPSPHLLWDPRGPEQLAQATVRSTTNSQSCLWAGPTPHTSHHPSSGSGDLSTVMLGAPIFLSPQLFNWQKHYISFRYTTKSLNTCTYRKMITTVSLANIYLHRQLQALFSCDTFKRYSLSNFQIHNTILTTVTVPCITSRWHLFYNWKCIPLTLFTCFTPLPPSTSGKHPSVLCISECGFCILFV